jgi:nitrite reductase/ring-hydroxylating ferredoxin subunit
MEPGSFVRVARVSDIRPGRGRTVKIGLREVGLYVIDGRIHAVDGVCPHMRGPLAEGRLAGAEVTCPWHGWRFDVTTGACLDPARSWARLRVHEVRIEGDDVLVALRERERRPPADVPPPLLEL